MLSARFYKGHLAEEGSQNPPFETRHPPQDLHKVRLRVVSSKIFWHYSNDFGTEFESQPAYHF